MIIYCSRWHLYKSIPVRFMIIHLQEESLKSCFFLHRFMTLLKRQEGLENLLSFRFSKSVSSQDTGFVEGHLQSLWARGAGKKDQSQIIRGMNKTVTWFFMWIVILSSSRTVLYTDHHTRPNRTWTEPLWNKRRFTEFFTLKGAIVLIF